ncbi:MAG: MarR family winged helix-turn-helix transcriptional regulator [Eubacteriales bacterium]|nr:MarR family winged helix-turn-helix transcriptional regulator [Eubacteriales bacterium]
MNEFAQELNALLVDTFHAIMQVEERMLHSSALDLSIGELHMIEAIAKNRVQGKTIGDIALEMDLSMPSVTIAINKLVKKGYVEKYRCQQDGRRVFVKVTRQGARADAAHRFFHENMIRSVVKEIAPGEQEVLLKGVKSLNHFFSRQAGQMRATQQADRPQEER